MYLDYIYTNLASKQFGLLKANVATPEEPSRALVNFTSGTTFSSSPLTNWMLASSSVETREEENAEFGANAAASGRDAINAVYFMFLFIFGCGCYDLF